MTTRTGTGTGSTAGTGNTGGTSGKGGKGNTGSNNGAGKPATTPPATTTKPTDKPTDKPATTPPPATPAVEPEVLTLKLLPITVSSVPPAYEAELIKIEKRVKRMIETAIEDGDTVEEAQEYASAMRSAAISAAATKFKVDVDSPDSYLGSRPDVVMELRKIRALAGELRIRMNKLGDLLGTSGWRIENLKIDMDSSKPVTLTQKKSGGGTGERASPDTLEPRELYAFLGKRSTLVIKYEGVEYSADCTKDAVVDRISKKSYTSFHSWQKDVLAAIEAATGKSKVHAPSAYDFIRVNANGEIKKLSEYRKLIRDAAKTETTEAE